ncbi:MAG: T9SS type A sorting domain-containing protein [Bacteroidia bacterium]
MIFILSFGIYAKAQNLVYNGNFEIYYLDTSAGLYIPNGWYMYASPDYYNVTFGNVPYSLNYQQDCCGGQGYIGEYMMCSFTINGDDSCREYIETKLTDTLQAGHIYLASVFVNKADMDYSIATIGMLFTDTFIPPPPYPQFVVINGTPQIKNTTLISDTVNWILVQNTFMAVGNEVYLTLGNFSSTATSDTVKSSGTWAYSGSAYYYIDGVSVYDVTGGACNNYWEAGYDKYIFSGDSIRLGAINTDGSTFSWQNSMGGSTYLSNNIDPRPWSKPIITTTYYVTKICPNNNVFKDTVTVYVRQSLEVNEMKNGKSDISIFPNPNNGVFTVQYDTKENSRIEIIDINGALVGTYNLPTIKTKVEVRNENLQNGVYLYRIISNNNMIKFGKIVVMK